MQGIQDIGNSHLASPHGETPPRSPSHSMVSCTQSKIEIYPWKSSGQGNILTI